MAVIQTPSKVNVSLKLNNGTTTTGAVKTVSVSLGTLKANPSDIDNEKVMNIVNLLAECLDKSVVRTDYVQTSTLSEE